MVRKTILLSGGLEMPVLGLGTWQVEDPLVLKAAMNTAFENGYRHFDTAYMYKNENIVGKVIERWISKGMVKREDLFITTKLPMAGVHPDRVEMFLKRSLKNLGLEYVDLYLVHFPVCLKFDEASDFPVNEAGEVQTEPTDHIAVWKKMEEQVYSGRAKAIGLSNFSKNQVSKVLEKADIKPSNLQIEIHLYLQNNELVDFCKEKGISVVAYSPLGSPGINEFNKKKGFPNHDVPQIMSDEIVVSIAKKHSKSPAQIMLRFLIQRGLAAIPKSTTPSRIKENIDIFDFKLDPQDMSLLRTLDKGNAVRICSGKAFKGLSNHPEYPYED